MGKIFRLGALPPMPLASWLPLDMNNALCKACLFTLYFGSLLESCSQKTIEILGLECGLYCLATCFVPRMGSKDGSLDWQNEA